MAESKGVEAVERALKILDCFGPQQTSLSLAELSRESGFYKSTILRLIVSLERFGYIVRQEDGCYRLGPKVWQLGAQYRNSFDMAGVMRPQLKLLSDETNETASYYIREGNARVCLFRSEPVRAIRHAITEGARMPLGQGASGKVLRAYSEDQQAGDAKILELGYAISMGERDPEVAAIAVPVFSASGVQIGALSVSGLISRFSRDRQPALIAALQECQARVSKQLEI